MNPRISCVGGEFPGEENRGVLQDRVGLAQVAVLPLELLEPLLLAGGRSLAFTGIDLSLAGPAAQGPLPDAQSVADGPTGRGQGGVVIEAVQHQAGGPLLGLLRDPLRHTFYLPSIPKRKRHNTGDGSLHTPDIQPKSITYIKEHNHGHTIAYTRVSSAGQTPERQAELAAGCEKVFSEKASAKTRNPPQLTALIDYASEGDTVRVYSVDRLARDLRDLDDVVRQPLDKGVRLEFIKERIAFSLTETADPAATLMFQMLGAFAQFERTIINERRQEGVAAAKAAGKRGHRPPVLTAQQQAEVAARHAQGVPMARIAREAGISRTTAYKALREARGCVEGIKAIPNR
ncbi:recombinase family protein [Micrococcus endophyticus]|nr:recombinase family protein [Micrococcus endophyticus]